MQNRWKIAFRVVGLTLVIGCLYLFNPKSSRDSSVQATPPADSQLAPRPVVEDMHQFMEYVFEPNYKTLRLHLAEAPSDKNAWKAIKAGSLSLAESGNLLLMRAPEEDGDQWRQLSAAVRGQGGELYQAARARDYQTSLVHYRAMIEQCNACHTRFADGEHQLKP